MSSPQKYRHLHKMVDILIRLNMVIILQGTHISKHLVAYLKYIQVLFVNYTPIKLLTVVFKKEFIQGLTEDCGPRAAYQHF